MTMIVTAGEALRGNSSVAARERKSFSRMSSSARIARLWSVRRSRWRSRSARKADFSRSNAMPQCRASVANGDEHDVRTAEGERVGCDGFDPRAALGLGPHVIEVARGVGLV